jgi:hypothetical protein
VLFGGEKRISLVINGIAEVTAPPISLPTPGISSVNVPPI